MIRLLTSVLLFSFVFSVKANAQESSAYRRFRNYIQNAKVFNYYLPQEKVYLHLDNTCYYIGDTLWFNAYVVTADSIRYTNMSKVLYVGLLSPEGVVVDRRKLEISQGQCHGEFALNKLLMYSGYYEIRAYTRYMMNFGEEAGFSRVIPIFDRPQKEGAYQVRKMSGPKHGFPSHRPKEKKKSKVNVSFYPEGGHMVQQLSSRVAFKVTDAGGNAIAVQGCVLNADQDTVSAFSTLHEGMGAFEITPAKETFSVNIDYQGKTYRFSLLPALSEGYSLKVESGTDSVGCRVSASPGLSAGPVALVFQCRGQIIDCKIIERIFPSGRRVCVPRSDLPTGVNQVSLIDNSGKILAERLFFVDRREELNVEVSGLQQRYLPFEKVNLGFRIGGSAEGAKPATFSLAIRDAATDLGKCSDNLKTNLLLASDLKGFVRHPEFYFEEEDTFHKQALDLLMMVQGWRRYNWEIMAGIEPFSLEHELEKSILIDGYIAPLYKSRPVKGIELSVMLKQDSNTFVSYVKTDSLGRFRFQGEFQGDWNAAIQTKNQKGKTQNYDIYLNRNFAPPPRLYTKEELHVFSTPESAEATDRETFLEKQLDSIYRYREARREDSLMSSLGNTHLLKTAEVKKRRKATEKEDNLQYADRIYDAPQEIDQLLDKGEMLIYKDVFEFLSKIDNNFVLLKSSPENPLWKGHIRNTYGEILVYKNRRVGYVFNDRYDSFGEIDALHITDIDSIAISESPGLIQKYFKKESQLYGCLVLIYGNCRPKKARGIRTTTIQGYSPVAEYFQWEHSQVFPDETDYRRTLYWNPRVAVDSAGHASVQFYNNSSCSQIRISASVLDQGGKIGVLEK